MFATVVCLVLLLLPLSAVVVVILTLLFSVPLMALGRSSAM